MQRRKKSLLLGRSISKKYTHDEFRDWCFINLYWNELITSWTHTKDPSWQSWDRVGLGYQMPNTLKELHDIWNNDFQEKGLALVKSIKHSWMQHNSKFLQYSLHGFRSNSPGILTCAVNCGNCHPVRFYFCSHRSGTWQWVQLYCRSLPLTPPSLFPNWTPSYLAWSWNPND